MHAYILGPQYSTLQKHPNINGVMSGLWLVEDMMLVKAVIVKYKLGLQRDTIIFSLFFMICLVGSS